MPSDADRIATLERKVDALRNEFLFWNAAFVMILPALAFAFGMAPELSFIIMISAAIALLVVVVNRAWKERART